MPFLRRPTPAGATPLPSDSLGGPPSSAHRAFKAPSPIQTPAARSAPSTSVTPSRSLFRSPAPYVPPKGRTVDQVTAERTEAALRKVYYPCAPSAPHAPKGEGKTAEPPPVTPTKTETNDAITPPPHVHNGISELLDVAAQQQPPVLDPENGDIISRLPLSVHGKLYFEVTQQKESVTKHASTGIIVVTADDDFAVQMFDRDGRQFGNRPGDGYPIAPGEVAKLQAGCTTKIGTKEVTLRTAVKEDEFRSGSFFLDSQKKEKERQQRAAQAAAAALALAQPQKKSILLSSVPQGRFRCGLRSSPSFVVPFKGIKRDRTAVGTTGLIAPHDPDAPGAVVLFRAQYKTDLSSRQIVSVVVDPVVGQKLRPHQVQGVQFLYDCVNGNRVDGYYGCILADEMGLGKSLQAVTLIWTCLRQGMYGSPITRRAMVVAPCSLVENWRKEFAKWLGEGTVKVFAISESTPKGDRILSSFESEGDVLVISYDQLRKYIDRISKMTQVDLVVCDEGHKLKNADIKTTKAVFQVATKRRVILSGTPIQNDLTEFHAMVSFINPGILGPLDVFCRVYEEPILKGREPSCEESEKLLGQDRAHFLSTLTSKFILRRTQTINEKYLPAKVEVTVFCKLSKEQEELYQEIVSNRGTMLSNQPFAAITALRQLSSHMSLLLPHEGTATGTAAAEQKEFLTDALIKKIKRVPIELRSAKLAMMVEIVSQCRAVGDKIVIISNFTQTLNLIADALKIIKAEYFQLDGTTPIKKRQQFVDQFNAPTSREIAFLLSSKAGGVGLNLIGANRLILFDPDWNPANDAQAMGRVWRDGQKKTVFIYRFLSTGTIEEKIYMRQVSKQGLSSNIVDSNNDSKQHFSVDDLRTLFLYNSATQCETHDLLNCLTCSSATKAKGSSSASSERKPMKFRPIEITAKGPRMEELKAWNHLLPGIVKNFDALLQKAIDARPGIVSFAFAISRDPQKVIGNGVETERQFNADSAAIVVEEEDVDRLDIEITQSNDDGDSDEE